VRVGHLGGAGAIRLCQAITLVDGELGHHLHNLLVLHAMHSDVTRGQKGARQKGAQTASRTRTGVYVCVWGGNPYIYSMHTVRA
jgi:hypothetical protein